MKCLMRVWEPCPHPSPQGEFKDQKLRYKERTKMVYGHTTLNMPDLV